MNKSIFFTFIAILILLVGFSVFFKDKKEEPVVKETLANPIITASSSIILQFKNGKETVLFSKNPDMELPLASITKLVTAYVSTSSELFHPMLVESSNEAAEKIATPATVAMMNGFAKEIGLKNTMFFNPSGKDAPGPNFSSAKDIAHLMYELYQTEHGKEILMIGRAYTPTATNKSLVDPRIPFKIIGGKTGETSKANQTLTLLVESGDSLIALVVLGSKNRFEDMAKLAQWTNEKINR